jgi:hypothetical protein
MSWNVSKGLFEMLLLMGKLVDGKTDVKLLELLVALMVMSGVLGVSTSLAGAVEDDFEICGLRCCAGAGGDVGLLWW